MQAVCFVMGWFFVSCIGFVRGCFFCHGVGFPQWQLYAAVFVVRGGLRKRKPFVLSSCWFSQGVLVPCGAFCFVVVLVFPRGIGSLRCVLFCRRVGFSRGQLYAVVLSWVCFVGSIMR